MKAFKPVIEPSLIFETWNIDRFIGYARNPRKNDHAVDAIAAAIKEFGFRVPIVAKSDGLVVDGHLRLKAAKKLGLSEIPVILADDLTDAQIKAFRLSVNKMAELADWDMDMLKIELEELGEMDFDLDLTGFGGFDFELDDELEKESKEYDFNYQENYSVLVVCKDELHQTEIYDRLIKDGLECKVLVN